MQSELRIGLIGLDTSHVTAFSKLLNDASAEYSVAGGKIIAAFPGGSPDFPLSINRVDGFTQDLKANYGVEILHSPEAVAEKCDAIMLTAVDGRTHRELFARLAPFKKPIFVDKPFAISSSDAQQMMATAQEYSTPLMSCSSLRYAQPVADALAEVGREAIISVDATGPMALEVTQNNIYWYGIHSVEVLFAAMGVGCVQVQAVQSDDYELLTGVWSDGRVASVRGDHAAKLSFSVTLHCAGSSRLVDAYNHAKPPYAALLGQVIPFFQTGESPIDIEETLQIVRFIEAANQSRESGKPVAI